MKLINWNSYYHLKTIKLRREYLQSSFNDKEKSINKKLFIVNPIEPNENLNQLQKTKRKTSNALKNMLRHLILPFPITWSHRNTDRLVKKKVYSIEDYMMGDYRHKDHISALRTGAPQYRSLLIGASVTLIGLMVGISAGSLGIVPAIALGATIGTLAAYSIYGALRASRKSQVQVAFLKSRMGNVPENNQVEKLFTRAYTLVRNLEDEKRNLEMGQDSVAVSKEKIITTLKRNLSSEINDDKGESEELSKLVKDHVEEFIQNTRSATLSNDELKQSLNQLIVSLEDTDFYTRFEAGNENTRALIDDLINELQEKDILDPKVPVLQQLKELEQQHVQNGGTTWNKDQYIQEIQNSSVLTQETKDFLTDKLGGAPVISYTAPIYPKDILNLEKTIMYKLADEKAVNLDQTAQEEKKEVEQKYLPFNYDSCPSDEEKEMPTQNPPQEEIHASPAEPATQQLSSLLSPINSRLSDRSLGLTTPRLDTTIKQPEKTKKRTRRTIEV